MKAALKSRGVPMFLAMSLAAGTLLASPHARSADAEAAEGLARQSGCFKCHGIDKKKVGPALKDASTKYKADKDAVAKLTKHVTGAGKMMNSSGKEENHPAVKSKKPDDVKNLVDWILTL